MTFPRDDKCTIIICWLWALGWNCFGTCYLGAGREGDDVNAIFCSSRSVTGLNPRLKHKAKTVSIENLKVEN